MWNLNGDDIQRAKAELTGRRAAIQARYDSEIKQLADDLAVLESFERAAVNFVSNYKGQDMSPATAAADSASENSAAAGAAADPTPAAAERSASRWRMRLSTAEGSPQAADE